MRFPKPRRLVVRGKVRWLVRTPKAMGGGREYCETKGDAEKRIKSFRQSASSTIKEFTALHSGDQAMLLGLLAQFDRDVRKLKAAAELGAGKVPATKLVAEAVKQFGHDHHAGVVRKRNIMHVLNRFALKFGERSMTDIETIEIERWMNEHEWGPKMHNDCRQALSQFWKHAIKCKSTVTNPVTDIPVRKVPRALAQIYTPEELQAMLRGLAQKWPEAIPIVALGAFAGLRMTEIGRLSCEQVRAAMKAGYLELATHQAGKTLEARIIPILPNLKAWLTRYLPESGPVIPDEWTKPTRTKPNRMDELGRYIARRSKVAWKPNALRHSYGTYRFKKIGDVAQVVDEMGTSLRNFERHYRNRSKLVTAKSASDFFAIRP